MATTGTLRYYINGNTVHYTAVYLKNGDVFEVKSPDSREKKTYTVNEWLASLPGSPSIEQVKFSSSSSLKDKKEKEEKKEKKEKKVEKEEEEEEKKISEGVLNTVGIMILSENVKVKKDNKVNKVKKDNAQRAEEIQLRNEEIAKEKEKSKMRRKLQQEMYKKQKLAYEIDMRVAKMTKKHNELLEKLKHTHRIYTSEAIAIKCMLK